MGCGGPKREKKGGDEALVPPRRRRGMPAQDALRQVCGGWWLGGAKNIVDRARLAEKRGRVEVKLRRRDDSVAARQRRTWPLHDIVITNIIWCISQKRGVGVGSYIAQSSCDSIAIEWAMQADRMNKRSIDSCTKAPKLKNIL